MKFFEIVPKTLVPTVAIKKQGAAGWRCDVCGRTCISHAQTLGICVKVVCRADLPSPLPPILLVGTPIDYSICVSRTTWERLRGQRGTRKVTSHRLAVAEVKECQRIPKLPTLDQLEEFRRKYGFKVPYRDT